MDGDESPDEPGQPFDFDLSDSPPKDRSVRRRTASSTSQGPRGQSPRPRLVPVKKTEAEQLASAAR